MVMNGFDTDGDGENNFYTVNGKAFYYAKYPIRVRRSETVRIYLANLTEFDLINSFHLHGDFFRYYPTGIDRPVRVHRHRHAVPGPARDHRDRLREHRPLHVPCASVRVRRARLDGLLRGRRRPSGSSPRRWIAPVCEAGRGRSDGIGLGCGEEAGRRDALASARPSSRSSSSSPCVSIFASAGGSLVDLVGTNPPPPDQFDIQAGRVQAGRDPHPRTQSAAGGRHDRRRRRSTTRSSRSRWTARRRSGGSLADGHRALRVGRGRPVPRSASRARPGFRRPSRFRPRSRRRRPRRRASSATR